MNQPTNAANFPYGMFISFLRERKEGFELDIEKHVLLSKVFLSLPPETDLDTLRNIIGSLICKSPEQQERYQILFRQFIDSWKPKDESRGDTNPNNQLQQEITIVTRRIILAFVALAIIGLTITAWWFNKHPPKTDDIVVIDTPQQQPPAVIDTTNTPGDTTTVDEPKSPHVDEPPLKAEVKPMALRKFPGPSAKAELEDNIVIETIYEKYIYEFRFVWLPMVLLFALAWSVVVYYRRQLIIRYQQNKTAPYIWKMDIEVLSPVKMSESYTQTSAQLRKRIQTNQFIISYYQTVVSTAKKLGMLQLQYRRRSAQPDYLVLIDKSGDNNLYSEFQNYVVSRFMRDDIHITRYFYRNDPAVCWNEQRPQGVLLQQLLTTHASARLIIIGDAHRLINTRFPEITDEAAVFLNWKERAILSPRPLLQWSVEEYILSEQFVLLPANEFGWSELVNCFEEEIFPDPWKLKYDSGIVSNEIPLVNDPEKDYEIIKEYFRRNNFPSALMDWLCACCIYPELNWSVTLTVGQELSGNGQLLTQENLDQLASLTWFRSGKIPEGHQVYFLGKLAPDKKKKSVAGVLNLLQKNAPNAAKFANTHAYDDYKLKLVITELLLEEGGAAKRDLVRRLKEQSKYSNESYSKYYSVLQTIGDLKKNPLDFIIPRSARKYFYKDKFPYFRPKEFIRITLTVLLAVIPYLFRPGSDCNGKIGEFDQKKYCLATAMDSAAFDALRDPALNYRLSKLDSSGDGIITYHYNRGVDFYTAGNYDSAIYSFAAVPKNSDPVTPRRDSINYFSMWGLINSLIMFIDPLKHTVNLDSIYGGFVGAYTREAERQPQSASITNAYFSNTRDLFRSKFGDKLANDLEKKYLKGEKKEPVKFKLRGKVSTINSDIGLSDVTIFVVEAGVYASTGPDGYFSIDVPLKEGSIVQLGFHRGDMQDLDVTYRLSTETGSFKMTPLEKPSEIGIVKGYIHDEKGRLLGGVQVSEVNGDNVATSASDGAFKLFVKSKPGGVADVTFKRDGYDFEMRSYRVYADEPRTDAYEVEMKTSFMRAKEVQEIVGEYNGDLETNKVYSSVSVKIDSIANRNDILSVTTEFWNGDPAFTRTMIGSFVNKGRFTLEGPKSATTENISVSGECVIVNETINCNLSFRDERRDGRKEWNSTVTAYKGMDKPIQFSLLKGTFLWDPRRDTKSSSGTDYFTIESVVGSTIKARISMNNRIVAITGNLQAGGGVTFVPDKGILTDFSNMNCRFRSLYSCVCNVQRKVNGSYFLYEDENYIMQDPTKPPVAEAIPLWSQISKKTRIMIVGPDSTKSQNSLQRRLLSSVIGFMSSNSTERITSKQLFDYLARQSKEPPQYERMLGDDGGEFLFVKKGKTLDSISVAYFMQRYIVPTLHSLVINVSDYKDRRFSQNGGLLDLSRSYAKIFQLNVQRYLVVSKKNSDLLNNPTRAQFMDKLSQLSKNLGDNDDLLIYFSGLVYQPNEKSPDFYLLPADAQSFSKSESVWISKADLEKILSGFRSKHILVIIDPFYWSPN